MESTINSKITCYHCGETVGKSPVHAHEKDFCCEGCRMVYEILNDNGLCNYYDLEKHPGLSQKIKVRHNKFAFLDDLAIAQSLITFKNEEQTHISLYLPQMHCSSCLWLLENLHKLNPHVISSKVNFTRKEVYIVFENNKTSLRKIAELLTSIGYEPYISLNNLSKRKSFLDKSKIYKLGVAGFCFANIMLFSFPEYLGIDSKEANLAFMFRLLNVLLALPVFFYSATEFYSSAWKSLKHGFLNIDAPIVLAIWVTFGRSIYEVATNSGAGYFDSMSGIVFFMLVGRVLQDKTYQQLSFERDYTSYFPIAITRVKNTVEESVALPEIKLNDTLLIHHEELIPADGIITRGKALIDYSFVTGESVPVEKQMGEIVYAGGKQVGGNIEILVIKEVAQSYLTRLWNRDELQKAKQQDNERSFVHLLSRGFTWIVLGIAFAAAVYWYAHDASKVWHAITAVLIVACPCALLLSNTFTNGNIIRILGKNHFYLRNAQVIEDIANVDYIVFDKTGTLTTGKYSDVQYEGAELTMAVLRKIVVLASQSTHPMSRSIVAWADMKIADLPVVAFKEHRGKGIEGIVDGDLIMLGSPEFVTGKKHDGLQSCVYVSIEDNIMGKFVLGNNYRQDVDVLLNRLRKQYPLAVISGDNTGEKKRLAQMLGTRTHMLFNQKPEDKLEAISDLQLQGHKIMMIGDGLNDAGALKAANVGVALTDSSNNFTPASDVIIEAEQLPKLLRFIKLCKVNKKVVLAAFIVSVLYNIIGIYFAVTGNMSPLIAAILMPSSSISILLLTFGVSNVVATLLKLK